MGEVRPKSIGSSEEDWVACLHPHKSPRQVTDSFHSTKSECSAALEEQHMPFRLDSTAFQNGASIPLEFTCDGPDESPALTWTDPPTKTQSFALVVDDPDAPGGIWVHWVLYDLPADTRELTQGVAKDRQLTNGARQGRNDFGKIGYNGPCPPRGPAHRYFFKLYA